MDNLPALVTAAFAIAVFFGAMGCIALLLRNKFTQPLFIISLVAVIVQFYYELFMTNASDFYTTFDLIMTIMIPIVSVFLIWISNKAIVKGWIY